MSITRHFAAVARKRANSFSPNDIPNLAFALDADDLTGISDGANTGVWTTALLGSTATPAGGTNPIKQTYNGYPIARCSGNSFYDSNSFLGAGYNTAITILYVYRYTTTGKVNLSNAGTNMYLMVTASAGEQMDELYNFNQLTPQQRTRLSFYKDFKMAAITYDGSNTKVYTGYTPVTTTATTGNLTLSGAMRIGEFTGGGFQSNADFRDIYVYNRALTQAEIYQLMDYCRAKSYGIAQTGFGILFADGDSLTANGSPPYITRVATLLTGAAISYKSTFNGGVGGQKLSAMNAGAISGMDAYINPLRERDVVIIWGGTNDIQTGDSVATVTASMQGYIAGRRAVCPEIPIVALTTIARGDLTGGQETIRQDWNTELRNNYAAWGITKLVDVAALPEFDSILDTANVLYYDIDTVHLATGGIDLIADAVYDSLNPW